jgi:hypothetical protein
MHLRGFAARYREQVEGGLLAPHWAACPQTKTDAAWTDLRGFGRLGPSGWRRRNAGGGQGRNRTADASLFRAALFQPLGCLHFCRVPPER